MGALSLFLNSPFAAMRTGLDAYEPLKQYVSSQCSERRVADYILSVCYGPARSYSPYPSEVSPLLYL